MSRQDQVSPLLLAERARLGYSMCPEECGNW